MLGKKITWGLAALLLGSSAGLADVIDYGANFMGNVPAASSSVTLNWASPSSFNVTDLTTGGNIIHSGADSIYSPYSITINFGSQSGNTLNVSNATINMVEKNLAGTTTLASYSGSLTGGGFSITNASSGTFDLKFTNGGDWSGNYTIHTAMGLSTATYNADLVVAPVPSALYGAAGLVAGLVAVQFVRRRRLV